MIWNKCTGNFVSHPTFVLGKSNLSTLNPNSEFLGIQIFSVPLVGLSHPNLQLPQSPLLVQHQGNSCNTRWAGKGHRVSLVGLSAHFVLLHSSLFFWCSTCFLWPCCINGQNGPTGSCVPGPLQKQLIQKSEGSLFSLWLNFFSSE